MKKICNRLECKNEFETIHSIKRYCCKECYVKNKWHVRKELKKKRGSFTTQTEIRNNAAMEFIIEMGFDKIISCPIKKSEGVVL